MSGSVLALTFVATLGVTHSWSIVAILTTTAMTLVSRRLFGGQRLAATVARADAEDGSAPNAVGRRSTE